MEHIPQLLLRLEYIDLVLGFYYKHKIIKPMQRFERFRRLNIKKLCRRQIKEFDRV